MVPEVIARLNAQVPELAGRIEPAMGFAQMVARNAFPQHTPAAQVMPTAFRGGKADAAAGLYRQDFQQIIAILLTFRPSGSATGAPAEDQVGQLLLAVMFAIAGWEPPGAMGPFELLTGGLVHTGPGLLVYQLDFVITDQLRIA